MAVQAAKPEAKGEAVALWVGAAVLFGLGIWGTRGGALAEQYFAGYLVEQSLSVDNLFVFILVFRYFKTPQLAQDKVRVLHFCLNRARQQPVRVHTCHQMLDTLKIMAARCSKPSRLWQPDAYGSFLDRCTSFCLALILHPGMMSVVHRMNM